MMGLYKVGCFLTKKTFHQNIYANNIKNHFRTFTICIRNVSNTFTIPIIPRQTKLNDNSEFDAFFPNIVKDLTAQNFTLPEMKELYTKLLNYNVPHGKQHRGLTVVDTYKLLETPDNLTQENIKLSWILGWCTELFQANIMIVDDIIDKSETRRGCPCWYKLEDIGVHAANDAQILNSDLYLLLKKYFSNLPYYVPVIELFHEAMSLTCKGQALEFYSNPKALSLDVFTMERFHTIVKYKTMYMIKLPLCLGMHMAGKFDEKFHSYIDDILCEICYFFQAQNDMQDCFGDSDMTGKMGNDIAEGKCTWLAVKALQKASLDQRKVLDENIGSHEQTAIDAVKRVYEELDLQKEYLKFKEDNFKKIQTLLNHNCVGLPQSIFLEIINKMYRKDVLKDIVK